MTEAEAYSALGALIGVFAIFGIILLAIAVFYIVSLWKIFNKGNQPGWASIIPIYNQYILCKMVGVSPWWILIAIFAGMLGFIPVIGSLVSFAVSIYFAILLNVSLARAFGKEDSYAIGLILLPIVFYPMLAFSKVEYVGANPMEDMIFKDNNANNNTQNNQTVNNNNTTDDTNSGSEDAKFCPSCGEKLSADTKFCNKCGTKIK